MAGRDEAGRDEAGREVARRRESDADAAVRRVLRAGRDAGGFEVDVWVQIVVFAPLAVIPALPAPVRWCFAILLVAVVAAWLYRRARYRIDEPLRLAAVESAAGRDIVFRLDDGSLWGFTAAPRFLDALAVGDQLTLPEPREGPLVVARRDPVTGAYTAVTGSQCRLFRPLPTTYVTPAAIEPGPAGRPATPGADLSREQAAAFLARAEAQLRSQPIAAYRRGAVLADIGTEPTLELVEVTLADAHRVQVRRADGQGLRWPVKDWVVRLRPGDRLWATRPVPGLHVVLVALTDEGRRAALIWPEGPAEAP